MKKKNKIITGAVSLAAVVGIAASALTMAGAANSDEWAIPAELEAGAPIAQENPSTGEDVKIDRFDNVQKDEGEKAGLVDESSNKSYFTIEVSNPTLLDQCPSRVDSTKLKPTRSKFLVLDVKATLANKVSDKVSGTTEELFMPLIAEAWSITGSTGAINRNVTSETAWGCYTDAELLPALVNPGQTVSGKVVLDVDEIKGKVAYDPENNGGWSWPFGA